MSKSTPAVAIAERTLVGDFRARSEGPAGPLAQEKRKYTFRKRGESIAETRLSILRAASASFLERGIQRTSMAEVARRAGVAQGSVFHHFSNREGLIEETLSYALGMLPTPRVEEWDALGDPLERMAALIRQLHECYAAGATWRKVIATESASVPALARSQKEWDERVAGLVTHALGPLARDKTVRPGIMAIIDGSFWMRLVENGASPERALDIAVRLMKLWVEQAVPGAQAAPARLRRVAGA